jgi:small multidrug resistance pump
MQSVFVKLKVGNYKKEQIIMKKIIGLITKPLRLAAGLLFILLGTIPTVLVPGIGLFLGLPFLLIGGALVCC